MPYTHLKPFDRMEIQLRFEGGESLRSIAKEMGRAPSTISREIKRNSGPRRRYKAARAQTSSQERRKRCRKPKTLEKHPELRSYVVERLREQWSPEQIAGSARKAFPFQRWMRVCHETIYTFVYTNKRQGGELYTHLRQAHRTRRRRGNRKEKRGLLPGRVNIALRPPGAENRSRRGHWEGDTVIGAHHQGGFVTLAERKTRFLLAAPIANRKADTVHKALLHLLQRIFEPYRRTLTLDNGKEFAHFKLLEEQIGIRTYFADPYCSWQRGTNENTNGLLRQYFPKKTTLLHVTPEHLNSVVQKLNNRPRKTLGYRTPHELFSGALQL